MQNPTKYEDWDLFTMVIKWAEFLQNYFVWIMLALVAPPVLMHFFLIPYLRKLYLYKEPGLSDEEYWLQSRDQLEAQGIRLDSVATDDFIKLRHEIASILRIRSSYIYPSLTPKEYLKYGYPLSDAIDELYDRFREWEVSTDGPLPDLSIAEISNKLLRKSMSTSDSADDFLLKIEGSD